MAVDTEPQTLSAPLAGKMHQLNLSKSNGVQSGGADTGYAQIDEIADKFRSHFILPIVGKETGSSSWTALVPGSIVTEHATSVDKINDAISSRSEWKTGDVVVDNVTVRAKIGQHGLLLSAAQVDKTQQDTSVHLDESGSSANVSLVVRPDGALEVHKTCSHDGIDENGRPWLERQNRFLETSVAVQETDIFVKPLRFTATDDVFSIDFPYLASQTLAQLAMAGMGGGLLMDVTSELMGEMAERVWPKTGTDAPSDFIEKAHFDRIDRRVAIARAAVAELGAIVDSDEIVLNGRRLLGFHSVMKQLRSHAAIKTISPTLIGEIHGDLNLHNILCCVGPSAKRPVALIDPRGVHLLSDFAKTRDFEPGDYAYELSKLKFSLSAFSEIRHGFLKLQGQGTEFKISFDHHSGSDTMRSADAGFFDALEKNDKFMEWVKQVEPSGFEALRKRVLLGEAANFVADAACALGRDTVHEVIPLFLIGLDKLNSVLAMLNDTISEHKLDDWFSGSGEQDTTAGILAVQKSLLRPRGAAPLWHVLEIAVPAAQVPTAEYILTTLRGKCFPLSTGIYRSSSQVSLLRFPCVLLHGVEDTKSQAAATISSISQAESFFDKSGVSDSVKNNLQIISIQPGAPAKDGAFSRLGNNLLAPGPWGASPLELLLLTAQQLRFAQGGRWVLDDALFFVLSKELEMPAADACTLKLGSDVPSGQNSPMFISTAMAKNLARSSKLAAGTDEKLSALVTTDIQNVSGGDKASIYRFGSVEEYKSLTAKAKSDPDMNSLAFLAATLTWCEQWKLGEQSASHS